MTKEDSDIIDTSSKIYNRRMIHGFTVHYEPDVFDVCPNLLATLREDLFYMCVLLPERACEKLQRSTHLWINTELTYGDRSKPIHGKHCCFHPGAGWLQKMGMNVAKCGGVEMYSAQDYLDSRHLWGPGGLLLHEYCHAYHCHHTPGGYDCIAVREVCHIFMHCIGSCGH